VTRVLIALIALGALAGCGGSGADRAGGSRSARPVVLTFAAGDGGLPGFAAAVQRLSHGTMQIRFSHPGLKLPSDFESQIIAEVRSGKADLGWVGSRAFPSFDALTAPLLIDSYAFEGQVVKSPVVEPMLRGLSSLGLIGIGVLPGPMRWPAGARPLRGPDDFGGLRIGTQRGNVGEATLKTLGARPVPMGPNQLVPGLDGVEQPAGSWLATASTRRRRT
jgi:TRAP-type C4-dicarboxylate transport system substrate-binding protein